MVCNDIGKNISKIRRALGITQSELGQAVGVSTQAVSRWECGGMPDTELLPAIADKLDVSIDSLFGRKNSSEINIETLLYNEIKDTPDKNKMEVICKYIWLMQQAASTKLLCQVKPLEDMLISIYMSAPSENFTVNLASSRLNISIEDAKIILDDLYEHCMINHITVVDKDNILDVYSMETSIKLEIFLFFCNAVMKSVKEIPLQLTSRKKSVFKSMPGTNSISPRWITRDKCNEEDVKYGFIINKDE